MNYNRRTVLAGSSLAALMLFLLLLPTMDAFARTPPRKSIPTSVAKSEGAAELKKKISPVRSVKRKISSEDPCLSEAQSEFDSTFASQDSPVSQTIASGVTLQDTPELLKLAKEIFGLEPQKDAVARVQAAECRDVICALTAVFGSEEAAMRALVIDKREGLAFSISQHYLRFLRNNGYDREPFASNPEILWSTEELRTADKTLAKLPPVMKHMKRLKNFYRVPHGEFGGTWLNDTDSAGNDTPNRDYMVAIGDPIVGDWGVETLFHELSHHLQGMNYTSNAVWTKFKAMNAAGRCFVTDYARNNKFEDWAESSAHFLVLDPDYPNKCPEKFRLMRDEVFKGFTPQPVSLSCD